MALDWFKNLKNGLHKSSSKIGDGIKGILNNKKIDESTLEFLEDHLITSDIGVEFSSKIISDS